MARKYWGYEEIDQEAEFNAFLKEYGEDSTIVDAYQEPAYNSRGLSELERDLAIELGIALC